MKQKLAKRRVFSIWKNIFVNYRIAQNGNANLKIDLGCQKFTLAFMCQPYITIIKRVCNAT